MTGVSRNLSPSFPEFKLRILSLGGFLEHRLRHFYPGDVTFVEVEFGEGIVFADVI